MQTKYLRPYVGESEQEFHARLIPEMDRLRAEGKYVNGYSYHYPSASIWYTESIKEKVYEQ